MARVWLPTLLATTTLAACSPRAVEPPALVSPISSHVSVTATPKAAGPDGGVTVPSVPTLPEDAPGSFVSACEGVRLVLLAARAREGNVEVEAELRNEGTRAFSLMATTDGSVEDMRNPSFTLVTAPAIPPYGRCAEVAPLSEHDFFTLAPGRKRALESIDVPAASSHGKHLVRAVYLNDPSAPPIRGVAMRTTPSLYTRVRETTPCRLVSNTLEVELP